MEPPKYRAVQKRSRSKSNIGVSLDQCVLTDSCIPCLVLSIIQGNVFNRPTAPNICIFITLICLQEVKNSIYFNRHATCISVRFPCNYTGRFMMFSAITNIYNKQTKGPNLMELFTATEKLKKFLWHGAHRYDIQVRATHVSIWVHRYSSLLQWSVPTVTANSRGNVTTYGVRPTIVTWSRWPKGTDNCSSEGYRCTHVDACVARAWISYRCAMLPHPYLSKKLFNFPVAVNNSINL
jgi:hypothetical protein